MAHALSRELKGLEPSPMRLFEGWNGKRLLVLALFCPAMLALGGVAGLSHFAGKPLGNPAQVIPVAFGCVAGLLLAVFAVFRFSGYDFRLALRMLGGSSAAIGAL